MSWGSGGSDSMFVLGVEGSEKKCGPPPKDNSGTALRPFHDSQLFRGVFFATKQNRDKSKVVVASEKSEGGLKQKQSSPFLCSIKQGSIRNARAQKLNIWDLSAIGEFHLSSAKPMEVFHPGDIAQGNNGSRMTKPAGALQSLSRFSPDISPWKAKQTTSAWPLVVCYVFQVMWGEKTWIGFQLVLVSSWWPFTIAERTLLSEVTLTE